MITKTNDQDTAGCITYAADGRAIINGMVPVGLKVTCPDPSNHHVQRDLSYTFEGPALYLALADMAKTQVKLMDLDPSDSYSGWECVCYSYDDAAPIRTLLNEAMSDRDSLTVQDLHNGITIAGGVRLTINPLDLIEGNEMMVDADMYDEYIFPTADEVLSFVFDGTDFIREVA